MNVTLHNGTSSTRRSTGQDQFGGKTGVIKKTCKRSIPQEAHQLSNIPTHEYEGKGVQEFDQKKLIARADGISADIVHSLCTRTRKRIVSVRLLTSHNGKLLW